MLLENDVIQFVENNQLVRVLWLDLEEDSYFLIDIKDQKSIPFEMKKDVMLDALNGKAAFLTEDPFAKMSRESQIAESYRTIRDKRLGIIHPLIISRPGIFYSNQRWQLILDAVSRTGCTPRLIYKYLRIFWQEGQKPNSLLPKYGNSGAKGKIREPSGVKRGRPKKYSDIEGINVTEDMRRTFKTAVSRYYATDKKFSKKACFDKMLEEFFCIKQIDTYSGRITVSPAKGEGDSHWPSFRQFEYWMDKSNDPLQ